MNKVLDRIDGEAGLLASAQKATDAFGTAGKSTTSATHEMEATMRDIRDAADAIRTLADAIERDPDMLVKGRSEPKGKSR